MATITSVKSDSFRQKRDIGNGGVLPMWWVVRHNITGELYNTKCENIFVSGDLRNQSCWPPRPTAALPALGPRSPPFTETIAQRIPSKINNFAFVHLYLHMRVVKGKICHVKTYEKEESTIKILRSNWVSICILDIKTPVYSLDNLNDLIGVMTCMILRSIWYFTKATSWRHCFNPKYFSNWTGCHLSHYDSKRCRCKAANVCKPWIL